MCAEERNPVSQQRGLGTHIERSVAMVLVDNPEAADFSSDSPDGGFNFNGGFVLLNKSVVAALQRRKVKMRNCTDEEKVAISHVLNRRYTIN